MAGVAARLGFHQEAGNQARVIMRHAAGVQQALAKFFELIVVDSRHVGLGQDVTLHFSPQRCRDPNLCELSASAVGFFFFD
jgi:hypothetical protein